MAISLTLTEFAAAIRAGDGVTEPTGPERIAINGTFRAVRIMIDKLAPIAPAQVANEALIRAGGYLYDAPEGQGDNFLVRSGAQTLLKPWTTRRLAGVDDGEPDDSTGPGDGGETEVLTIELSSAWTPYDSVKDPRIVFLTDNYDFEIDTQGIEGKNINFDPPDSVDEGYQYFVYADTFPDLVGLGLLPGGTGVGVSGFTAMPEAIVGSKVYRSDHLLSGVLTSRFTWFLSFGNF